MHTTVPRLHAIKNNCYTLHTNEDKLCIMFVLQFRFIPVPLYEAGLGMRLVDYVPVRLSIEEGTRGVYVNRLVVHNGLVSLLRILGGKYVTMSHDLLSLH